MCCEDAERKDELQVIWQSGQQTIQIRKKDIYSETSMQIDPVALKYQEVQKVTQRIRECK